MDKTEIDIIQLNGLCASAHAAILLRIPESGDPELDAMIRNAQRRDLVSRLAHGMAGVGETWMHDDDGKEIARRSMQVADDILAALSTPPEGGAA